MAIIHRNNDTRGCGASTIASQSKLTIAGQAVALVGDVESHGGAPFSNNGRKVTFKGIPFICVGDSAPIDSLLHGNTQAATGFGKFTIG